ncbi:MAG: tetraacyldisaccharide 4'-kinase [Planctomycetota bacterium]|jgi:tetraacyldisaccharide 4'-kinase
MDQYEYKKLISGRKKGIGAAFLRLFLALVSLIYAATISLRNFLYSAGLLKSAKPDVPVICIGNITTGGTGKTPLVIWLANHISQNHRCAVITRGYKTTQNYTDEPALIAQSCPCNAVIVNPDRLASAREAVNKYQAQVLIADDAFQHRRLKADLNIVTIDATEPFGYGKMLPAGLLREPLGCLARADAIVITRCDQVQPDQLDHIEKKIKSINPNFVIAKSIHSPICAESFNDQTITIEQLKTKKIFAFCGIGNPDAFLQTIKNLELNLVGSRIFNDHHQYTTACLGQICNQAQNLKVDIILTTQKDRTKIPADFKPSISLARLKIEIKFLSGCDKLKRLIETALAGKISQKYV